MVGHGGVVVFDDTVDMSRQARFAMEFCAKESCGKCTPCRLGSVRGVEVIDRIVAGIDREANLELLEDLCETMVDASLCAMGGLTPYPVLKRLGTFPRGLRTFEGGAAVTCTRGLADRGEYNCHLEEVRAGCRRRPEERIHDVVKEHDLGTPGRPGPATVELEVDGLPVTVPEGDIGHAGGGARRRGRAQIVCHRQPGFFRLLPPVPRRDRRSARGRLRRAPLLSKQG